MASINSVQAQDATPDLRAVAEAAAPEAEEEANQQSGSLGIGATSDRAGFGNIAPTVQLTRNEDDTELSFGISTGSSRPLWEDGQTVSNGDEISFATDRFSFVGTLPIDGDSSNDVFSFGKLGAGTTAKFSFTRFVSSYRFVNGIAPQLLEVNPALKLCITSESNVWIKGEVDQVAASQLAASYISEIETFFAADETPNYDAALSDPSLRNGGSVGATKLAEHLTSNCIPGAIDGAFANEYELISKYIGDEAAAREANYNSTGDPLHFFGVSAELGTQRYPYVDKLAFEKKSTDKLDFALEAYVGLLDYDDDWSLKLSSKYSSSHSSGDEIKICRTDPMDMSETCLEGADGRPTHKRNGFVQLEARKILKLGSDGNLLVAISPEVTFDVDDGEFGVDVPVYFVPDENGNLNAGMKFGYRSDTNAFGIGFFLDVPFSLNFD